ncbi:MAG: hypothetical protein QOD74_342 [Variibacter sp.]|nr:hypothetical protein [Variibacter sp.]
MILLARGRRTRVRVSGSSPFRSLHRRLGHPHLRGRLRFVPPQRRLAKTPLDGRGENAIAGYRNIVKNSASAEWAVIASGAKQSRTTEAKRGLLRRFAPRKDGFSPHPEERVSASRRMRPRTHGPHGSRRGFAAPHHEDQLCVSCRVSRYCFKSTVSNAVRPNGSMRKPCTSLRAAISTTECASGTQGASRLKIACASR